MFDTACIYLKPSEEFCDYLSKLRISPASKSLGFHTTLAYLQLPYAFEEIKDDIQYSIKKVAQEASISKAHISNIELWDTYSMLVGGNAREDIEKLHERLNLRLNLNGIRINNIYANVNEMLFEEENGYKPLGYTPHISVKSIGDFESVEGINFLYEPTIYLRAKTQDKGTLEDAISMYK